MFAKFSAVLALFAVAAQVAVATPPACLIAAINTQSDPSDIQSVCKGGASDVQQYLSSNCGGNLNAANSAFAAVCQTAGVTIATSSGTKSSSGSASTTSAAHSGTKSATLPSGTLTNGIPIGTGVSSGFHTTRTTDQTSPSATSPSSGDASGSAGASSPQPSQTSTDNFTGGAARLGMDVVGLAALGVAGFMFAL